MMRLFIGIELPQNVVRELERLKQTLAGADAQARLVPRENYHVTLRFLGETGELAPVAEAMREAVRGLMPFSLHLTRFDLFPNGVAHAGVAGDRELFRLEQSLVSALRDRGFSGAQKGFVPHVTLARRVTANEDALRAMREQALDASFCVRHIALFESVRKERGMEYLVLHRQPLH